MCLERGEMKMVVKRKKYSAKKFDLDIGFLLKSPCKTCHNRERFPECFKTCQIIDRIQTLLAQSVLTTRSYSDLESFAIHLEQRTQKD